MTEHIEPYDWTHLRMLSKMDLKVQIDAKSSQLKIKVRVKFLVYLVMHKKVQVEQQ